MSDRRFWAQEAREAAKAEEDGAATADAEGAQARTEYPNYVEELRAALAAKDEQLRGLVASFKEEVAKSVEETKSRLRRENEREVERMRGRVVEELLEVLDNLDRSMEASSQSRNFDALAEGIKLVAGQFSAKLQGLGLTRFDTIGEPFDPAIHEAIGTAEVTDPAQNGRVVREIKAGYRMGDKVLRPALVQVGQVKTQQDAPTFGDA